MTLPIQFDQALAIRMSTFNEIIDEFRGGIITADFEYCEEILGKLTKSEKAKLFEEKLDAYDSAWTGSEKGKVTFLHKCKFEKNHKP